ncbi:hypothetical protein ATO10_09913 [Actibacterium atlanticum]|uniref:Sulfotransferase n=1 Tax=Actibacterium atlanticum TaxID=1461693 RepID=A0A058ZLS4_9RHOB|nr:sulfotransferase [Actibacterium atlanticum]KCV82152.1 hypothetical protein ATO10_09913 [Actibacterium atlanticum]
MSRQVFPTAKATPAPFGRLAPGGSGAAPLFDPTRLLDVAKDRLGGSVPLDQVAQQGFELLCADLEAAAPSLSFTGKKLVQNAVLDALVKRGWALSRPPQAPEISRPIFILSPYRSATTFLHRVLGQDPRLRAPKTWEVAVAPVGPNGTLSKAERVALVDLFIRQTNKMSPKLSALHPTDAQSPEECAGFLETSFASASFLFLAPLETYLNWLGGLGLAQMQTAYQAYDACLRSLPPTDQRWVLKCPTHLWGAEGLMQVYPDAQFIRIKRPAQDSIASYSSLVQANHDIYARRSDPARVHEISAHAFNQGMARFEKAAPTIPRDQVLELQFESMRASPLEQMRIVYDWLGLALSDEDIARLQGAIAAQPK